MTRRTVLFDLDGTLLDTAGDLAAACNAAAVEAGLEALPIADLKPFISGGAAAMLTELLARNQSARALDPLHERMLDLYAANIATHTRLFDGMDEVLHAIEADGLAWGIITNKIARFTDPLLAELNLTPRAGCVISGDTVAEKKPHPLPMLEACRRIGTEPQRCVYIGDARRDIEAGRNAGMATLAAAYGYVPADDPAAAWGADALLDHPRDLLEWLRAWQ